jgi:SAM-dependent methyltransferase
VLAQTYRPIEVILVDDGSSDETAGLCDALAAGNPLIQVVHLPHRGRVGLVREAGRARASGEFIQYLDSDDVLLPRKFEIMTAALRGQPECDIAYGYTRRYRRGGVPLDVPTERTGQTFTRMLPESLTRRFWHSSTPLYTRRICDKAGPWSDLLFWEDVEYDTRMAAMDARLCHCPEFVSETRDHDFGRASRPGFYHDPALLAEAVRAYGLVYGHAKRWGISLAHEALRDFLDDFRIVAWRCRALGLEDEVARCQDMIREMTGRTDAGPLEPPALAATLEPGVAALAAAPGETITLPVRVVNRSATALRATDVTFGLSYHLLASTGEMLAFENERSYFFTPLKPEHERVVTLAVTAPAVPGRYAVEVDLVWETFAWFKDAGNPTAVLPLDVGRPRASGLAERPPAVSTRTRGGLAARLRARWRMAMGLAPLSYAWGTDRGLPVHRYYVEEFLREFAADVRGRCLEFAAATYVPRFGGSAVTALDILHMDDGNPRATLTGDLTRCNDLPGARFDCIVCTHVLHLIFDVRRATSELHRMLKPGGVLLVAVPHVGMIGSDYRELWGFTPEGLVRVLGEWFEDGAVTIRAYGNSLAAAAEIRGVVTSELTPAELDTHDPRFAVEVCARAVKR